MHEFNMINTIFTFSDFTFFKGALLVAFASSEFIFLFPFADFDVEGVPRADPEVGGFTGLVFSVGSSLRASFCLGASAGEISSSIWPTTPAKVKVGKLIK